MDDIVVVLMENIARLEGRIDQLERDVAELMESVKARSRPLKESVMNVCALDADRNSTTCVDATVYRYQQGCRGVSCVRENKDYYEEYRRKKRDEAVEELEPDTVG